MDVRISRDFLLRGIASSGSKTTLIDTTKNISDDVFNGKYISVNIGGIEYIRAIVDTLDKNKVTFATLNDGTAASAVVGAATEPQVTVTFDTVGVSGNNYCVNYILASTPSAETSASLVGNTFTAVLGTDAGTAASVAIGTGTDGTVTTTYDSIGVAGNDNSIEVTASLAKQDAPLSATFTDGKISVSLATKGDTASEVKIGEYDDGGTPAPLITVSPTAVGSDGNSYFVKIVAPDEGTSSLDVSYLSSYDTLQIVLAVADGDTDIAANAASAIKSGIEAISLGEGSLFEATVASGQENVRITEPTPAPIQFTGGTNALDADANTATLIAAEISTLEGFTAEASGDGSAPITSAVAEKSFEGGLEFASDATGTEVAAAINALDGVTASMTGTSGDGVLSPLSSPVSFSGGVDIVTVEAGTPYVIFGM